MLGSSEVGINRVGMSWIGTSFFDITLISNWILALNFWNDSGIWDDSETWND